MKDLDSVTLATIGGGAAEELFQAELDNVLNNILDPNTDPEAVRSITVKITFDPSNDREKCGVEVQASSKLAPNKCAKTVVHLGRKHGLAVAYEFNPKQAKLFDDPAEPAKPTLVTGRE